MRSETGSTDACEEGCRASLHKAAHIHSATSGRLEKLLMRSTMTPTPPHKAGQAAGLEARVQSTKAAGRESRGALHSWNQMGGKEHEMLLKRQAGWQRIVTSSWTRAEKGQPLALAPVP
jgi:hypothetical protein